MDVETQPISVLRQSTRNLLKLSRRNHRDEASDSRRDFSSITNPATVVSIANKLKTKSAISAQELHLLKNALLDDDGHIETVLSTHGALRGLVREISGHDIRKQCEAVGCCTNLVLSDGRGSMVIATAAGSYLIVCLDSLSNELAVTSAWAIGNIAATSKKACNLLTEQGALAKLIDVALNTRDSEVLDSALYALSHFVTHLKEELRPQHIQKMLQALSQLKDNSKPASLVLFSLSCHDSFLSLPEVNHDLVMKLLEQLYVSIQVHVECPRNTYCCELNHVVRTLANICVSEQVSDIVATHFVANNFNVPFKAVLDRNDCVSISVLWLLGNLYRSCSGNVDINMFMSSVVGSVGELGNCSLPP